MYYINPTLTQFNAPYGLGVYGLSPWDMGPMPIPDTGSFEEDEKMAEDVIVSRMTEDADLECPYGQYKMWTGMNWICQKPLPSPKKTEQKEPKDDAIKLSTALLVATPVLGVIGFLLHRKYAK